MQPDEASMAAEDSAIANLLRGNAASLENVECQAKQGNRVAALACGYWHQARDAATAVSYMRQAAEAGNSAAAAFCSWSDALQETNRKIRALPPWQSGGASVLSVASPLVATIAILMLVWWAADTPRFQYANALAELSKNQIQAAYLILGDIVSSYPRSRWARRAEGGALVLKAWDEYKSRDLEAAEQHITQAADYPTEDFGNWYDSVQAAISAEHAANELYQQAIAAEKCHELDRAVEFYKRISSQYAASHAASEAKMRIGAVEKAQTKYQQAKAAYAKKKWQATFDLCNSIEATGVQTYKVPALIARAYEKMERWSLAAAWWYKSYDVHHTPSALQRWNDARRIADKRGRKGADVSVSGMLVSRGRARLTIRYENVCEYPIWGLRLYIMMGPRTAFERQLIPKTKPLKPGEKRTYTTVVNTHGRRSFSYGWSDVHKLARR